MLLFSSQDVDANCSLSMLVINSSDPSPQTPLLLEPHCIPKLLTLACTNSVVLVLSNSTVEVTIVHFCVTFVGGMCITQIVQIKAAVLQFSCGLTVG